MRLPLLAKADAVVDFTIPKVSVELAALAAQARIVHVIGTTGLSADDETKIRAAARHAVIVKSGNMSLGVNLLAALVKKAAKALPDFDIEIVEMHHRMKVDAPSGTALLLGQAAASARNVSLDEESVRARDGHTGAREKGAIGFATLRGGTVVGEHDVVLAGEGERVVLSHVAEDRSIFATRRACGRALGPRQEARPLCDGGRLGSFRLTRGFDRQHRPLARQAPMIAMQRAVAAQHAMARNQKRNRIAPDRCTNRARSLRRANLRSDSAIGRDRAGWNRQQRLPHLDLPRRAEQMQLHFFGLFASLRRSSA